MNQIEEIKQIEKLNVCKIVYKNKIQSRDGKVIDIYQYLSISRLSLSYR